MATNRITLDQALDGFLLNLQARHLSPSTIADYTRSLRRLQTFLGASPPLATITADQLHRFMADLEVPRSPAGVAQRPARPLSKKQCLNIHTGISAFFTWAVREGYAKAHLMRLIDRPRPEKRAIIPFTKAEVESLLKACERSQTYTRPGKRESDHARATGVRDTAILLLLVDCGLRASELCDLQIRHLDIKNRRILAFGKGDKERSLPFSSATGKAIWQYLTAERREVPVNEPLFIGLRGDRSLAPVCSSSATRSVSAPASRIATPIASATRSR